MLEKWFQQISTLKSYWFHSFNSLIHDNLSLTRYQSYFTIPFFSVIGYALVSASLAIGARGAARWCPPKMWPRSPPMKRFRSAKISCIGACNNHNFTIPDHNYTIPIILHDTQSYFTIPFFLSSALFNVWKEVKYDIVLWYIENYKSPNMCE